MTHPGSGLLTPGVLRLLAAMAYPEAEMADDGFPYDEYEAVCDRWEVWVGDRQFHRKTLNAALQLCAISDVSDEGGFQRYTLNAVGRCFLADPSQADQIVRLLYAGQNITVREGKISALDE